MWRLSERPGFVTSSAELRPKSLKIGDVDLANRVLLAPMSGVTDAPFRRLAARLGAGLVVSEMTASDDLGPGRPISRVRCDAAGADIIDINMGCPARHVTGGQSGSALMRDLDHAVSLIEATISAVKVPVTLKMRLWWGHPPPTRARPG